MIGIIMFSIFMTMVAVAMKVVGLITVSWLATFVPLMVGVGIAISFGLAVIAHEWVGGIFFDVYDKFEMRQGKKARESIRSHHQYALDQAQRSREAQYSLNGDIHI